MHSNGGSANEIKLFYVMYKKEMNQCNSNLMFIKENPYKKSFIYYLKLYSMSVRVQNIIELKPSFTIQSKDQWFLYKIYNYNLWTNKIQIQWLDLLRENCYGILEIHIIEWIIE